MHQSPAEKECEAFAQFHSGDYLRHNSRRLEHLASLNLPLHNRTVLEVGAGIGDHTHFYLDRRCAITSSDVRAENLGILRKRYPQLQVLELDLDNPPQKPPGHFEIIHCYGVLYHLKNPQAALEFMAGCCTNLLLLETCVSFGAEAQTNPCDEVQSYPTQSFSGAGCRPARTWVWQELKKLFSYVYVPITQPFHEEFPLDWTQTKYPSSGLVRAIFIGSQQPFTNPLLSTTLLERHQTNA